MGCSGMGQGFSGLVDVDWLALMQSCSNRTCAIGKAKRTSAIENVGFFSPPEAGESSHDIRRQFALRGPAFYNGCGPLWLVAFWAR
jgi:hypothetical protein